MVPHDVFVGEFSTNSELDSERHTSVESDFALVFRSDAHILLNNGIELHVQNKRMANHRKCICLLGGVGHQGRRTESLRKGGICIVRHACLRVTEALAHFIRAWTADTRWITTPWYVFNRSGKTKTLPLSNVEQPETVHSVEQRSTCYLRVAVVRGLFLTQCALLCGDYQVFLPDKRKAPPPMRRVSHKGIARRNGKWCPTTHESVLAWTAVFLIVIGNRGAGPAWAERVLVAATALELRGKAYRGLGRKRHCRERKKSIWTHRGDRTVAKEDRCAGARRHLLPLCRPGEGLVERDV